MGDARKRRFDAVCVWKLDRWGWSVTDSIKSIHQLTSLGVRFIAVTQNIDTDESNPMTRFLLHIRLFRRDETMRMRAEGVSWRKISAELGVPVTTGVEGCR
jgi:DNA invertase Pin-like site-specific DNA recombinase